MAEELTFWVCSCGKANHKKSKKCVSCGKRRPKWKTYAILIVLAALFIGLFFPSNNNDIEFQIPETQKKFLSIVQEASDHASGSNSLILYETLQKRGIKLTNFINVQGWIGTVLGVEEMQGKGVISIDIGGPRIVAGQLLMSGLDTLIPKEKKQLYREVINAKNGDKVIVSGKFLILNNNLVDLNYSNYGSLNDPKFLFDFTSISKINKLKY